MNDAQVIRFCCPQCNGTVIEEVQAEVTNATEINILYANGRIEYGEQANEGGYVDRYQCRDCGYTICEGGDENKLIDTIKGINSGVHNLDVYVPRYQEVRAVQWADYENPPAGFVLGPVPTDYGVSRSCYNKAINVLLHHTNWAVLIDGKWERWTDKDFKEKFEEEN